MKHLKVYLVAWKSTPWKVSSYHSETCRSKERADYKAGALRLELGVSEVQTRVIIFKFNGVQS